MASFLDRIFSGFKKQEAQESINTVQIEKDAEGNQRLRFGPEKDDYFKVEGEEEDVKALQSILSKVIESPTQLKKIKDMPVDKRPTLIRDHSGIECGGYCNGRTISIAPVSGTGYSAAATFCHEFQHQEQFVQDPNANDSSGLSLSYAMLNERMLEATADTARYQYMYEMKDKNPQAQEAYKADLKTHPGLKSYSKAKEAGKSERECILAGMTGYASNFYVADWYANFYHDLSFEHYEYSAENYADNVREYYEEEAKADAIDEQEFLEQRLMGNGKRFDRMQALETYTAGMTDEPLTVREKRNAKRMLNSSDFSYITANANRYLDKIASFYEEKTGKKVQKDYQFVRNEHGIFTEREKEGLGGLMYKGRNLANKVGNLFDEVKYSVVSRFQKKPAPQVLIQRLHKGAFFFAFDSQAKNPEESPNAIHYEPGKDIDMSFGGNCNEILGERLEKANEMFSILLKDPRIAEQLKEFGGNGKQMTLMFDPTQKEPATTSKNEIILNPNKKPIELAADFVQQLHIVQSHEKAKELSGMDSYADYMKNACLTRTPVSVLSEKRMTQAAADAVRAEFLYFNQDKLSFWDKLKLKGDKAYQAFKSATDKYSDDKHLRTDKGVVAAMEASAKNYDTDRFANTSLNAFKTFLKNDEGKTGAADLSQMMTKEIPDKQIAEIACAGRMEFGAEKTMSDKLLKDPDCNIVTTSFIDGVYALHDAKTQAMEDAAKREVKAAEPKQEVKAETKAAAQEVERPMPAGKDLLAMTDKMAFRASKSNQSDTYYKPDDKEAALSQKLVKMTKDALKTAGVDARSVNAKAVRAQALADYAQTPEGKKDMAALQSSYQKMSSFEKKPLMKQLQQTQVAQPSVKPKSLQSTLKGVETKANAQKAATAKQVQTQR